MDVVWRICFLIALAAFCSCQFGNRCDSGVPCMPFRQCPDLVSLRPTQENIQRIRSAFCGFDVRVLLVCCESQRTDTHVSPSPNTFVLGTQPTNLLPHSGTCGRPITDDKIIGGEEAPIGGYPWMAAFGYTEPGVPGISYFCSGSLINSKYVLTAAHCVKQSELGRKRLAVIRLGDWDLDSASDCEETRLGTRCAEPPIVAGFEKIVIHPRYDTRGRSSDDIALIRLNLTIDLDQPNANVEPVCLPRDGFDLRSGGGKYSIPKAVGWGLTEHGNYSSRMLRVEVPIVSDAQCQLRYSSDYVGNQLCVGGVGGMDTCSGDSGGPLVVSLKDGPPYTQVGIVSFGPFPCGLKDFPGVYTKVQDFMPWIKSNLRP